MDKLEQVSENPELKEEMEREVTSTHSQVLNQAASWANWAVGAIGAKFYKSANKPPPPASTTPASKSTEEQKQPNLPEKSLNKPVKDDLISLNNATDGWDNEDDDDWGSLEQDNKTESDVGSQSNNDGGITKEDFDAWVDDFTSNKVADKSSVVKQGIQTLNLVSYTKSRKVKIRVFLSFGIWPE